jgi:hypothetical protein
MNAYTTASTAASVGVTAPPRIPPKMMAGSPRGMTASRKAWRTAAHVTWARASIPLRLASSQI